MIQFLAAVALTAVTSGAPCAVVSEDFTPAFVASEVVQDIAVEVAYPVVEQEFAARVSELGLTVCGAVVRHQPRRHLHRRLRTRAQRRRRGPSRAGQMNSSSLTRGSGGEERTVEVAQLAPRARARSQVKSSISIPPPPRPR